ncbi:hypothetical protein CVT26_005645 [Gymnopilus dilepis]|uniref:Uncharacterized protein n=1 Tax=Gymnopilus dilepis TaxID=231916 RepID=A0A409XZY0_9AGAR|nr:hypothetical protein CVT26_005645 [Gymnopilus dilepis]
MATAGLRLLKSFSVQGPIRSAVFFPGRKRVVTSGLPDGSAHVWNLDSEMGDAVELRGHSKPVTCLAVLRGGNRVITGGEDGEVLLISPNILAVACADQTVKIFDVRTGKQSSEFSGSFGSRPQLAWSPVAQRLFSTSQNMKAIHVLTENGGKWKRRDMVGHLQPIRSFDIHPDGKFLASGGDDKVLRVWNTETLTEVGTSENLPNAITNVAFSPDGSRIISFSGAKKLSLWDSSSLCAARDSSSSSSSRDSSRDPLGLFFARYPLFPYDSKKVPTHEFRRLCSFFAWDKKSKVRALAYEDFKTALAKQFDHVFGTDVNSLASWQSLCARLGVDPIPDSLRKCKAACLSKNVNLVDLVGSHTCVRTFSTVEELSIYSFKTHRIFPKDKAKAGGLLRYLLRHLENPGPELDRYRNCDGGRRKHSRSGK